MYMYMYIIKYSVLYCIAFWELKNGELTFYIFVAKIILYMYMVLCCVESLS